ncbi:hypothetical protein ACFVOR_37180 [Streptomyces sp. NPDC057837]|uniref:hypothetical protein n=1 Tax=Streptomyces sp. NPDC057837 TaxID=3346260 RepID=UPI00369DCF43
MASHVHSSDLDDVCDTLAEIGDEDLDLIVTGFRNIARRARTRQLDPNHTQVLLASICASPDATDVVGLAGYAIAELTDHNPALEALTNDARKNAVQAGQEAAFRLTDDYLRRPASDANEALDHLDPERRCHVDRLTDEQRKELSDKVKKANDQSRNRPK